MPFDDTSPRTEPKVVAVGNTLASLGITPVPRAVAEQHKQKMLDDFTPISPLHAFALAIRAVRWETYEFGTDRNLDQHIVIIQSSLGPIPQPILNVLRTVAKGIRGAEFSVEYFSSDPVLNVRYRDALGRWHFDCLGVWDGDRVFGVAFRDDFN